MRRSFVPRPGRSLGRPLLTCALACASVAVLYLAGGCDAITNAKGSLDNAKGQADDAKGQSDSTKDQVKQARGGKGGGGGGDDAAAGDDDTRLTAKDAPVNSPISDSVDFKKDRYDWRKVTFAGKSGIATFELHWDEPSANLDIDVYNQFGDNVGKSPPKLEGQQIKRVLVEVSPGLYYYRVSVPTKSDASIYTIEVKWKGQVVAPPPPAVAAAPPPPQAGAAGAASAAKPGAPGQPAAPVAFASDPTKLLGNIVTAYRDGSQWVFYLDKGSASGMRAGMSGTVLDGPDGDKLVDGASFSVSQVIDANKSIARSSYQKDLGKNTRFVVNLK